jgi:hypothetical protein
MAKFRTHGNSSASSANSKWSAARDNIARPREASHKKVYATTQHPILLQSSKEFLRFDANRRIVSRVGMRPRKRQSRKSQWASRTISVREPSTALLEVRRRVAPDSFGACPAIRRQPR